MNTGYRSILETLVGFETTPDRPNRPLIDWIADRLDGPNVEVEVLPAQEAGKANLLARIGPSAPGGVLLSGHTDVVTAEDQDWQYEPFDVTEAEGRLYGRGTADMKGFVSLVVAQAPRYARLSLRRPIYLAFSHDEEAGCLGIPALIDHIAENCVKPDIAIIGEPTSLQAVTSHKSMHLFRTNIVGKEAHSSNPNGGANANVAAGKLVAFLDKYFADLRTRFPWDDSFDPPYCTYNIGRLDGGIATSFVANRCRVDWEFRTLPDVSTDKILEDIWIFVNKELLPDLRRTHPESRLDLNCWAQVPALQRKKNNDVAKYVRLLTGGNRQQAVSYGTEAGFYQQAGISAMVCGPGNIAQAHKADEFITIEQLEAAVALLRKLGEQLCE